MTKPGTTQYTTANDQLPEASVRGGIQYVINKGYPAAKIICGPPFYGSANTSLVREAAASGGTQVRLTFGTLPGGTYQVQYANSLTPPITWQLLENASPNAQGQLQIIDPAPVSPQRFYRAVYP